jgi:large subunit ribosomal protein L13
LALLERFERTNGSVSVLNIQGKYKPSWSPSVDCGDYVVIVNAKHVKFTGQKWDQKYYKWHTGWVGGLKQRSARVMLEKKPEMIMRKAITRMMKKNALRARYENRLLIYPEAEHPHHDQLLHEFNPVASVNPAAMPRFSHGLDHDHSLRIAKDPNSDEWSISARIFTPVASKKIRLAAKAAGHFGKGHTRAPLDSMYPDTFMIGPALTHTEWKRAREMVAADAKPAEWIERESSEAIDAHVSQSVAKQIAKVKHILANPEPKPAFTTPYLSSKEATEIMKNAPKGGAAPAKKK